MTKPDTLLRLITHLQNEPDPVHARHLLLQYIRKSSGAQLAILFTYNRNTRHLELQAYSGQRRARPQPASNQPVANGPQRISRKRIAIDGLFGSALTNRGFVQIAHPYNDHRMLLEERQWVYDEDMLLLYAIHTSNHTAEARGVLVLSFNRTDDSSLSPNLKQLENDSYISICTILLGSYLNDAPQRIAGKDEAQRTRFLQHSATRLYSGVNQSHNISTTTHEHLDALSELYEIGLVTGMQLEQQELYQHMLSHITGVIQARGSSLVRYFPDQGCLRIVATYGQAPPEHGLLLSLNIKALEHLAVCGPGQNYCQKDVEGEHLHLVTLSCNCTLLGAIALSHNEALLPPAQKNMLTYLGNVAALLLHNYDTRQSEQKMALDRERNRIARDMHDGVAQHIANALYKLELIQRLLERQQIAQVTIELQRTRKQIENGLYRLRQSIASLRPLELEKHNFDEALNMLLDDYKTANPEVKIICDVHEPGHLPLNLETPIFRFIQEAFNNIYKHAHATHITLRIYTLGSSLIIEVQDNGIGIPPKETQQADIKDDQHLGLRMMRERIQEAGGYWEMHSIPGEGTIVKARFTLQGTVTALTNRERDILRLLVEGLTNRAIAEKLSISQDTVKSHIHHIIQKMRVRDRTQAAVIATRQGWL